MKKTSPAESKVKIRAFHKDRLDGEMVHILLLSAFYGLETAKLFGWTVEHRYGQRDSRSVNAESRTQPYVLRRGRGWDANGDAHHHKNRQTEIKRMDAIYVFEAFRGSGVAWLLLEEARAGGDLHSFSAPSAVEWHLKNGFRNLGPKESEGTFEMLTGNYKPVYGLSYAMPIPTDYDRNAIRQLEEMERQLLAGSSSL